jgi:protein phosphatase
MRVGFIGNVHGQAKALESMVARLEAAGIDRLICLGDLVDRGPDSYGCVGLVKNRGFQ